MKKRWLKLAAVPVALSLVAAACGDDDDEPSSEPTEAAADEDAADEPEPEADEPAEPAGEGDGEVTITGPERDESEAGAIQEVLGAWGEENGIEITYLGDADWEANINTQVQGGNPPDISFFPQPGKLADFAREGSVVPLEDPALASSVDNWGEAWRAFGTVDGVQYGAPAKSDLKSLVWYQPQRFADAGYEVPTTFDDLVALADTIVAAGEKPWCVGIESGQATGWTFTDWVEDITLRKDGADFYDDWVNHVVPFNDPAVVETFELVGNLWRDEAVFASSGTIAATAFQDNGQPLVDGDCWMHRQASFYSAFIPEGTAFADGSPEAVDVFYFPDIEGDRPVLGAGTLAAAFNNDPDTFATLAYISTPEYAEARQVAQTALKDGGLSGFLSAAQGQDPSVYAPLEQSFLEILSTAEIVRFDGSDLMPADVGAGTFWTLGTSFVNGDVTAQEAADQIEASWPS